MVLKLGAGVPVAVTLKLPLVPTVKVVALALVMLGAWLTVMVNGGVAAGLPIPFVAVTIQLVVVTAPAAAVPLIWVPVSVRLSGNVQPESASVGVGKPPTLKLMADPATPMVKLWLVVTEMAGA